MNGSPIRMLHRQSNEFAERNLFFQVVLGLLSFAERLDALLAGVAHERVPPRSDQNGAGTPHPLELILLGAIATSQRLRQHLAAAVPAPLEEPPPAVGEDVPVRPDALRRWLT